MKKKVIKKLGIILMFIMVFNIFQMYNTKSYAKVNTTIDPNSPHMIEEEEGAGVTGSSTGMTDVSDIVGYWKPTGSGVDSKFDDKIGVIAGVVRIVGTIISVITLAMIGIKFMLGSVEEKAQYKQTLIPWLIGAFLLFAISNVTMVIYNATKAMF